MLKFTKIFAVGVELVCGDGQTDRQKNGVTQVTVDFRNFAKRD